MATSKESTTPSKTTPKTITTSPTTTQRRLCGSDLPESLAKSYGPLDYYKKRKEIVIFCPVCYLHFKELYKDSFH